MDVYDPRLVNVLIDGTYLTGFGDGTFVQAEKDEENYTTHVGAKGEISRARNANPLGTITVTLKSTSPSNALLNSKALSGDTFECEVVDANDLAKKAGGSACWIEKPSGIMWGEEIETVDWTIKVGDYAQEITS